MKTQVVKFLLDHSLHIVSMLTYSFAEYQIGKSKKIASNSLPELIINNLWGKK